MILLNSIMKISPSSTRISFHVFFGALFGAPLGVMIVACISSLIGSFKGLYFGFLDSIHPFEIVPFLVKSIQNISEGSSNQIVIHLRFLKIGAQVGPFIFAALGFWLSYYNWDSNEETDLENPNEVGN